jgi:hypothetical protein
VKEEQMEPNPRRALVVMHVTTTLGRAGEELWVPVDDQLIQRAANGLLTVLWADPEEPDEPEVPGESEEPGDGHC